MSKEVVPEEVRAAGLCYTSDASPGISRKRRGRGSAFDYRNANGRLIQDGAVLKRIRQLPIPPAWEDVWICQDENGHLQAKGRAARRRKQSRYHPRWRAVRDETKFHRMKAFARALPGIRRAVRRDLALKGMPREKALATVVRLLETTLVRIGNEDYARKNHSYGLTTMKNRHVRVKGDQIAFCFRGKAGKKHEISVHDPQLAKIVRKCQEMPGQQLFEYVDEKGDVRTVSSSDVNEYLRSLSSDDFSAKDFRTWAGTMLMASALSRCAPFYSESQAKRNVDTAVSAVSQALGNTPTVCRKCYVHPAVVDFYMSGEKSETFARLARCGLSGTEKIVAAMLRRLKPPAITGAHKRATRARQASLKTGSRG